MAQKSCMTLFLYSYMLMKLFSYNLDYMQHLNYFDIYSQNKALIINVYKTKMMAIVNTTKTLTHSYI